MSGAGGGDVEDDFPACAGEVVGPVVMADDDAAVLRIAAGGDEGAAMFADAGGDGDAFTLFHFVVVVREFHPLIHGDEIDGVELGSLLRSGRRRCLGFLVGIRRGCATRTLSGRGCGVRSSCAARRG